MQSYGEQVALLDRELAELRLRLPKVHDDRIGVVEDEIEALQHALQDLELPAPAGAAERELQARDQTRAWLRQEKLRLGQREDRIRQEKANLLQLQLHLFEAKLQVRSRAGNVWSVCLSQGLRYSACETAYVLAGVPCDVESGELDTRLEEELVDCECVHLLKLERAKCKLCVAVQCCFYCYISSQTTEVLLLLKPECCLQMLSITVQ